MTPTQETHREESSRLSARERQCQALAGRTVVVIAGADIGKRYIWQAARAHGIRVVLVESQWPYPPLIGLGDEIVDALVIPRLHEDHTDEAEKAHRDEMDLRAASDVFSERARDPVSGRREMVPWRKLDRHVPGHLARRGGARGGKADGVHPRSRGRGPDLSRVVLSIQRA
jgi:hypothetical protein